MGSPARINTRGYGLCVHACWREAILSACGSNTHGKTRTNDDTRRVVTRLWTDAEWQHWRDRASARHYGVSHDFVKLRKSLSEDVSDEKQDRTYKNLWGHVPTRHTVPLAALATSRRLWPFLVSADALHSGGTLARTTLRPVYGIEASTQSPQIALQVRAFLEVVPSPDPAWRALMIGDTASPIGEAQAALALARQLQESVERLTRYCVHTMEASMPTRHQITIEFAFLLDDRVLWKGREGVYTIIWRRWHQGQVGEHVIYGICRVGEESNPVAQVYTAIESDLRLAPGQIAR